MNESAGGAGESDMQAIETVETVERFEERTAEVAHAGRGGRLEAWLLDRAEGWFHRRLGAVRRELFGGLPRTVVEIGAGSGASFRYLDRGSHVIAIEPNVDAHGYLHAAARRHGHTVDARAGVAERLPLADASVEAVISSLVLCTVADPARAVAEIRRVLKPGGRFWAVEHVAAEEGSLVARVQHAVERPWGHLFAGCSPRRDTERVLREAGFASVEVTRFTFGSAIALPVRPMIAAVAMR